MLFLKIIAISFLVLFIVKLLSPKVFPLIGKFFKDLFKLLGNAFFRSFTLLMTKTVYVVGIVILVTLVVTSIYTTFKHPNISDYKKWFDYFKENLLNIYVYTFFIGTYILGIIDYLKDRTTISVKFTNYFQSKINKKSSSRQYVYDEQTKKYTYK